MLTEVYGFNFSKHALFFNIKFSTDIRKYACSTSLSLFKKYLWSGFCCGVFFFPIYNSKMLILGILLHIHTNELYIHLKLLFDVSKLTWIYLYVRIYVYPHMWRPKFIYVRHIHTCMCISSGGQNLMPCVVFQEPWWFLKQGLSLWPGAPQIGWLV